MKMRVPKKYIALIDELLKNGHAKVGQVDFFRISRFIDYTLIGLEWNKKEQKGTMTLNSVGIKTIRTRKHLKLKHEHF